MAVLNLGFFIIFSESSITGNRVQKHGLAKFDENRRAVGKLHPMRDKNDGKYRGEKGTTYIRQPPFV